MSSTETDRSCSKNFESEWTNLERKSLQNLVRENDASEVDIII